MKKFNVRALCESAIMIAVATVLSLIVIYRAPMGGSVTPGAMLPVIVIGLRWGKAWGFGASIGYGLVQFLTGFYAITPWALFFDYIFAYVVLGFSAFFRGKKYGIILSALICGLLRFVVHYISGITIYAMYTPEGMTVWHYSLAYNGGYMFPEIIITVVLACIVYIPLKKYWNITEQPRG